MNRDKLTDAEDPEEEGAGGALGCLGAPVLLCTLGGRTNHRFQKTWSFHHSPSDGDAKTKQGERMRTRVSPRRPLPKPKEKLGCSLRKMPFISGMDLRLCGRKS